MGRFELTPVNLEERECERETGRGRQQVGWTIERSLCGKVFVVQGSGIATHPVAKMPSLRGVGKHTGMQWD